MFPTLLGTPMLRYDQGLSATERVREKMIGDDAAAARATLQLSRPISNGIVQDWDGMEAIWDHTFSQLGATPSEHFVVQTEAAQNPPRNRERIVESMFERYGFAGVNVSVQAILALNSQGLTSGFVVDSGDGVTHLVPVTDGYLEPSLVKRINLAGRHVTEHLMKLLVGSGHPLNPTADLETVREIKQKLCYVALDPSAEKRLARETTLVDRQYTLPDSRTMRIGSERFLAPEMLFDPTLHGACEGEGLTNAVFDTIRRSDMHVQKDYFEHIILSGGTTMFPGLSSRLERDLKRMYVDKVLRGDRSRASKFRVCVEDPPRRQHMVFLGASILADAHARDTNTTFFVTKREYEEQGASVVRRLIPTKLA
jgi:actin-related protein 2